MNDQDQKTEENVILGSDEVTTPESKKEDSGKIGMTSESVSDSTGSTDSTDHTEPTATPSEAEKVDEEIEQVTNDKSQESSEESLKQGEDIVASAESNNEEVARGGAEERSQASTAASETSEDAPEIPERQDPEQEVEEAGPRTSEEQVTGEHGNIEPKPGDQTQQSTAEPTPGRWYVVHTYAGHENKVSTGLKQKVESEHLEHKIFDVLVPTQNKIEIRGGKKETVKEKIFPGYILVKMELDDQSWLAVRTTPGVTSFVGMGNRPTPISDAEVKSIVTYMNQG
ncbi:hypothetical protein HYS97_02840, partial [Candidatus Daviesbacteria bacterium]|nr:hypothetical protein [Candidatus Daviesbacteria bacterium]